MFRVLIGICQPLLVFISILKVFISICWKTIDLLWFLNVLAWKYPILIAFTTFLLLGSWRAGWLSWLCLRKGPNNTNQSIPRLPGILVLLVLLVFSRFWLVFVNQYWYLLVFSRFSLVFVRKPLICYCFSTFWHENTTFWLLLLRFCCWAAGGLAGCRSSSPERSQ